MQNQMKISDSQIKDLRSVKISDSDSKYLLLDSEQKNLVKRTTCGPKVDMLVFNIYNHNINYIKTYCLLYNDCKQKYKFCSTTILVKQFLKSTIMK